jgi:hypothetical protein
MTLRRVGQIIHTTNFRHLELVRHVDKELRCSETMFTAEHLKRRTHMYSEAVSTT